MSKELLSCVEVVPTTPAKHSVIWLHGLGADGHDFEPIVPHLGLDGVPVRFVFPHAPSIPVTINMGMVMPAWYDILSLDLERRHDADGVRDSARRIQDLIARENERGVPTGNIVLAGFSQGGAIALHLLLRHPEAFRGVMALSTYLVCEDTIEAERQPANQKTPIFHAHGSSDPMVPVQRGEMARDRLVELGYDLEWHTYPMMHEVCGDEIRDLSVWLRGRFQ